MTVRIPWNRYEIALLFDTYERASSGSDINSEAVKLSESLRTLATCKGIPIDETYRNVNGMKMQLANVQYLFTSGQKGLSGASTAIRQMYELYKTDYAEYQMILKEAIRLTGSNVSIEDAFFAYAKERMRLSPDMITDYLQKATAFCHLKQPLLGMTDVKAVRNVQQKVAEGKLLRFRYGKDAHTIRTVTQLYYNFIKSYRVPQEEPPMQKTSAVEKTKTVLDIVSDMCTTDTEDNFENQNAISIEVSEESMSESNDAVPRKDTTEESTDCLWVVFDKDSSYLFTKPVSYTYRGILHNAKSWNRLYVEVCSLLFTDHHEAFMNIMNGDVPGRSALAFADEQNYHRMRAPKSFAPGYYLESNMDATSIVRKLCGLHQLFGLTDELRIEYRMIKDYRPSVSMPHHTISVAKQFSETGEYDWHRNGLLLVDWVNEASYAFTQPEAYEYKGITKCANKWGKLYVDLCGTLFEDNRDAFMSIMNGDIPGYNSLAFADEQHKSSMRVARCFAPGYYLESNADATTIVRRIRGLYRLFGLSDSLRISYIKLSDTRITELPEKTDRADLEIASPWMKYETVLKQAFPKGFQKESGLDIKRLRKRWAEVHGEELIDSDNSVRSQLAAHCIDTGKRWYLTELLLSDEDRQTVLRYIDQVFSNGKTILYYSSIYSALENKLGSTVLTEDLLVSYLLATCQDRYILRERYLTNDYKAQVNLSEEIKNVMLACGHPIHTDELKHSLHHLPPDQVERALHIHSEFIMDAFHMYFHESMVDLTDQELDRIAAFIQEDLDDQGYMISNRIQQKLAQLYPATYERLSFLTPLGVRGAVAYKLQDRFTFSGTVITPKGKAMNMIDVFALFCQHHVPFTLDGLADFAKECDSSIYWDTVHMNCARVSEKEFVATEAVRWNSPYVDAAIELYCPGKYISMQTIQHFDAFPYVGYTWNSYLLEQYIATASKDFILMHSSYAKNNTSGAIVRRNAGFNSFDDVLADILANVPVDLMKEPCLEYLANAGYITRRKLSNINEIISRAKMLRSQKG